MRLQILKNCRADGRHLTMGEPAELPQGPANELLALGLASIAPEPEAEPEPVPVIKPQRANPVLAMETASNEKLAMPPGKVPTKRGRPVLTPILED